MTIGGGVESMSRVGIGASGGAWFMDPMAAIPTYFMPQGISADLIATKYGFSRDDVDAYAVESQKRAAEAWADGRFKNSILPIKDVNGITLLDRDEHMRPTTTMQSLASLQAGLRARWVSSAASTRWRRNAIPKSKRSTTCITPAIRPASSTARRPC